MKMTLCFIFILFTFLTFVFSLNSFAQVPRPMVRLIYFLPSDSESQPDIEAKMNTLIKDVQQIYANEMERHGFGRKTFQIETDATGKVVIHRVNGQFADAYYQENWNRVENEISKAYDLSKNFYVTSIETNNESLCGLGAAHGSMGGSVLIPSSGLCFVSTGATTHELGHAFGLDHDFRNNLYHMSYGADWEKNQFSQCAAEWFDAHRAFNSSKTALDAPTTIKMLTPSRASSPNTFRLRFKVTDPNGLHQAQLRTNATDKDPDPGSPKLIDCKSLSGDSSTIEFITILPPTKNRSVFLAVMDAHGNITSREFPPIGGGPKIEGPWLWVIAPTDGRSGSNAAASGIDFLTKISGGTVTETKIATEGAKEGNPVGNKVWTLGKITSTGGDNINTMVNATGLGVGNIDHHVAYGSISLYSPNEQITTMFVGSDDAVKVWLNGELVHNHPVDRGASDYQDVFRVTLKRGVNILLVAIYEGIIGWNGFFGFAVDTEYTVLLPGTDSNEVLRPVVRVESPDHPSMYWVNTNTGTLHSLVGTEVVNLVPSVRNATSLAVDITNEKLYWTEKTGNTTGRIRRANLDGTNVQLVKNPTSVIHGIALDTEGGKIYLMNAWGRVQRLNIDGSNFQPNLIPELDTPGGLALDVSGGKMYWTEASGRIQRANLDGSNIEDVASGLGTVINIAISGNRVYWTEKTGENSGEIRSANLNGSPNIRRLHLFPQGFPVGLAVDAVENKLYWTTSRGSVGRSNLDGSNSQPDFVKGLIAPGAFALSVEPKVGTDVSVDASVDVLIYTGNVWWITRSEAIAEAETTKRLLQSAGIQAEITNNENSVKQWMLQTASDGSVDVLILYGPIPTTIYPPGNAIPDGSVAENWIETRDGNTILNHADYLGYWSTGNTNLDGQVGQQNAGGTLQNLMDIPNISMPIDRDNIRMFVTTDGSALTPSLVNFQSDRPFPLNQLQGAWFAEQILASDTGNARATLADPVVVRDGNRGRIAIVHQTSFEDNPKGEVAAEIIINFLLAEPVKLAEDINSDGVVNIQDLVLVASNFGQMEENPADVNGDGVVNITDLVKVAGALGNAAAAPSLHPQTLAMFTTADVQQWLSQAQHLNLMDATSQRGIRFLEQLLAALIPKETALLPNYPNPFNPETWIPYQLAKPAGVTLTIYAVNGQVVRKLSLGHQLAGTYQSRDRAAYWDGRNTLGEPVASGVYFYTLTAGDFTATRKMIIRK